MKFWLPKKSFGGRYLDFFKNGFEKTVVKIIEVVCGRFFNLCGKASSTRRVDLRLVRITKFPRFPTVAYFHFFSNSDHFKLFSTRFVTKPNRFNFFFEEKKNRWKLTRPIFELQIEDFEHASCFHKQVLQKIPICEKTKDKFQKKLFKSLHYIYLANQQTIRQPIKSVDNFFLIRLKKKFDFLNFSKS